MSLKLPGVHKQAKASLSPQEYGRGNRIKHEVGLDGTVLMEVNASSIKRVSSQYVLLLIMPELPRDSNPAESASILDLGTRN